MQRRRAFTLVEMLVAMALVIFIMVILSEAFVAGLESFRQLKAIGDMEERLRSVTAILRADLAAEHFDGRRRLSDNDFWIQGPPREGFLRIWQGSVPVVEGTDADNVSSYRATNHALHYTVRSRGNRREDFFQAKIPPQPLLGVSALFPYQAATNGQTTFFDADQAASSRYVDILHGIYTSPWKEVAVFLRPSLDTGGFQATTQGTAGGQVPLFGLYRRSLLAVPDNRHVNWESFSDPSGAYNTPIQVPNATGTIFSYLASSNAPFSEISCKHRTGNYSTTDTLYFNNPTDLTIPERRFGMIQTAGSAGWPMRADLRYPIYGDAAGTAQQPLLTQDPALQGADLLLDDVISFEVELLAATTPSGAVPSTVVVPFGQAFADFVNLFDQNLDPYRTNPIFYSQANKASPAVFDTWSWQRNDVYDYTTWDPNFTAPSALSVPLKIRVLAIKVTLRVWDKKTQQARQITLVQDT